MKESDITIATEIPGQVYRATIEHSMIARSPRPLTGEAEAKLKRDLRRALAERCRKIEFNESGNPPIRVPAIEDFQAFCNEDKSILTPYGIAVVHEWFEQAIRGME